MTTKSTSKVDSLDIESLKVYLLYEASQNTGIMIFYDWEVSFIETMHNACEQGSFLSNMEKQIIEFLWNKLMKTIETSEVLD